jgi:hypothetical protein
VSKGLPPYLKIESALRHYAVTTGTQDQGHIKPLHKYISLRLVIEGGFLPDDITPHPPLKYETRRGQHLLIIDENVETTSERTVIGGVKSKGVDVVVSKEGVGPVVCVSVKGTGRAFRNLTNRMEELIGDSANLHMMYPGLVYGFLHVLKANRSGQPDIGPNDVSVREDGKVAASVERWQNILIELSGRKMIHEDVMRYESIALILTETTNADAGNIFPSFPPPGSLLTADSFFTTLYKLYDLRFHYKTATGTLTKRLEWHEDSPAFAVVRDYTNQELGVALGYSPRLM